MSGADTSLEQYLGDVLRGSAKILGCDSTNLILFNEKTREIRVRLGTMARSLPLLNQLEQVLGESLKQAAFSTRDAADSLVYRCWRERCIVETSSLIELVGSSFPRPVLEQVSSFIGQHRFICVPALSGSRNYGVLLFQKEGSPPFNPQQREVLLRYARRIGEILENGLMSRELALAAAPPAEGSEVVIYDAQGLLLGESQAQGPAGQCLTAFPELQRALIAEVQLLLDSASPSARCQLRAAGAPALEVELTPLRLGQRQGALCLLRAPEQVPGGSLENQLLQLTLGDPAPALFVDAQFRITSCNSTTAQLLGYDPAELAQRPVAELFCEPEVITQILDQQLGDPSTPYSEEPALLLHKDGSLIPARVEVLFLADEMNQVVGFLVLLRKEVGPLKGDAEGMMQEDRLAAMGELAAQLAHEIRNPLVAIGATLQTLQRDVEQGLEPADLVDVLGQLGREVVRLDMTLKDYLAARHELSFGEVQLDAVAEAACRLLQDAYRLAGKRIQLAISPELTVLGDFEALKHVVFNLLLNALEASPAQAEVICRSAAGPHGVSLLVEDRGPGLCASAAECFVPFFTTKANGTGLGLAVCQKIARAHGGLVTLRERDGGGCQAVVALPRRAAGREAKL